MGRPKGSKNGIRQLINLTCETCGIIFKVEPYRLKARFCSRNCQSIGHAKELFKQESRICVHCGITFNARPASKKLYCSTKCSRTEHGDKIRGPRADYTKTICPTCGKSFSFLSSRQQVFCSKLCADKSFERRSPLICEVCGKTILIRSKFAKTHKYCSRTCRTVGIGKTESYIERKMAAALHDACITVYPQFPFGPYTLDFAISDIKLAIECDGTYWHTLQEVVKRDKKRDNYLRRHGWHVLRFTEDQINANIESCINTVREQLQRVDS